MGESWLILETSARGGRVGLAVEGAIAREIALDPARRHARDLVPTAGTLLAEFGLVPKSLTGVMVSVGPGSFTGLRVGVISAKALAFATGCRLVAVPTFAAIAEMAPEECLELDAISDGLKGLVYAQRFRRTADGWEPANELRLLPATEWATGLTEETWVGGPGIDVARQTIPPGVRTLPPESRLPTAEAVFRAGSRIPPLDAAGIALLEPTYLRPSSAEEQAARSA